MKSIDFEKELNPEQLAAVRHGAGPQLVLAGAGTGKTRVITYRVASLVREREIDPASIVAVTFTNKAAAEMRDRVERLLELYPLPAFVGTFHRYALQLLRRYGDRLGLARDFAVLDTDDQQSLVAQAMAAEGLPESSYPPRAVASVISGAKNRLATPDDFEREAKDFFSQRVARVYRRYQGLLGKISGIDFDDMISGAVRLLRDDKEIGDRLRRRVRHLLVDEFQDTNVAQLALVAELSAPDGNLTAVGDEDQGIYRWRGADLANILEFERHFPGAVVRKLERNYRSTGTILAAANAVVAHNTMRRGKRLWTPEHEGEAVVLHRAADEADEAAWAVERIGEGSSRYRLSDHAILVRTNAQTRAFEDEFVRSRIPYTLVGGIRFYERAEIKDLLAYLRVLRNPRDNFSLLRVLNEPPRGIGKSTVALLEERAAQHGGILWDVLELSDFGSFPARAAAALAAFRDLVRELARAAEGAPMPGLIEEIVARTGYAEMFRRDDEQDQARLENIREFVTAAETFAETRSLGVSPRGAEPSEEAIEREDLLTAFLDQVALVTDLDAWSGERGVSLMTLHSAKGLEFPVVFVAGLEAGLLPHFNTRERPEDLEEERRLFYVGMTRARERLLLSTCRRRRIAGRFQDQSESPFLAELPEERLRTTESPRLFAGPERRAVDSFFGRARREEDEIDIAPAGGPRRGNRVRHPTLGTGVVLEIEGSGDEAKLTVVFDRVGKRKLLARYAALELLV